MRYPQIAPGEYYHLFNRGVSKKNIFLDKRDYTRFLFLILHLQSLITITNTSYHVKQFIGLPETNKNGFRSVSPKTIESIVAGRQVKLLSFCLMPNHFHLCVREEVEGGIARMMQRTLMGYTKYFNAKYDVSGHVFQGQYKAVHVENNEQLLHLSAYIHRNPRELSTWKRREHVYPWSSYQDYINKNRWGDLIETETIANQFTNKKEYENFLKTSTAKESSL